ncbi:dna mismatch repair protein msh-2 [Nannochloropsis oceanica]
MGHGSIFRSTPDLERTAQRFLSFPHASRDKLGLRDLLEVYTAALTLGRLSQTLSSSVPEGACPALDALLREPLAKVMGGLARFQALVEEVLDIDRLVATHGREVAVKAAFDPCLLRLRDEMEEGKRHMEGLAKQAGQKVYGQVKDADKKIKLDWSAVHQHHFRVTKKDQPALKKIAASLEVQTLSVQKQGQLFTTPGLRRLSQRWAAQQAEYSQVQEGIVSQAVTVARTYAKLMQQGGRILAEMDVFLSLAHVASALEWCRPVLLDDEDGSKRELHITQLRHPVVEAVLPSASDFIPNDVHLSSSPFPSSTSSSSSSFSSSSSSSCTFSYSSTSSIVNSARRGSCLSLVTGPNCGGKSTYIRSVGVAVLLAQIGSCVPAANMEWTLVDKMFCRVGASDNQLQGVSTFMAEMLETRALLAAATPRSLVIVDELGRGTSTFDGFGLAWAVAERLAGSAALQCRTLFATHFHELCDMEKVLPPGSVQNLHFSGDMSGPASSTSSVNELALTYKVRSGPCDRSFGVHVARLARFPDEVVQEAHARVEALQAEGAQGSTPEQQRRLAARKRELELEERRRQKRAKAGEREHRRKVVAALAAMPPLEDLPLREALERVVAVAERGATIGIGAHRGTG